MPNPQDVLTKNFKKIAKVLGEQWYYQYHTSEFSPKDYFTAYQTIEFFKGKKSMLIMSVHHHDPYTLWIGFGKTYEIFFAPVDHIHFSKEDPKIILESFNGNWVSFIEISSGGKFREYHNFPKATYRLDLHS